MEFTERTELEKGFAALFHDRVRPALMSLESQRVERLAKSRRWMAMVFFGALAVAVLLFVAFSGDWRVFVGIVLVILGGIGALVARSIQAAGWSGAVEQAVMPAVCEHIGDLTYSSKANHNFPVGEMRALGMLPSYSSSSLSDDLRGRYRETDFELVEARLSKKTQGSDGKSKSKTVFRGLLFHIAVPVEIPTRILITRDMGAIGNKLSAFFSGDKGRGMPKVDMPHEAFEAVFEVHADDPDTARDYLPPAFLDSLLAIGEEEGGKRGTKSMAAGFRDRSFYLALNRGGEFLKMGSLSTPVADMEDDLHAIFADIEIVHRIIDRLHGG